ncbi:subtilisin-like protein [Ascobolus immersus RN42]|uniref:Subtilisin-like protein n=1 Tax=Ascobolus immersus RN42 TaxID=1160509 RepID=A0A3N4I7W9_ASCIM|nr:subtilisin-like protein [Ascobolus immersus RN42]
MANAGGPARQSDRIADPLGTRNCTILTGEQRWVGYGLAPNETPFRFPKNPPIFGSTRSYNIARGPAANNPDDLVVMFVRLHGNLTRDQEDEHYRQMFDRTAEQDALGIRGTGIVKDASSVCTPLPNTPKWLCYYAVYPRGMEAVIGGDAAVMRCSVVNNAKKAQCGTVNGPTWAHAAISKDRWSRPIFDKSDFNYRTPRGFERGTLGGDRHLFVVDSPLESPQHPEYNDPHGNSRLKHGFDLYPTRTPGVVNVWDHHADEVAILAAGLKYGVAPAAKIHSVNVFPEGEEDGALASDVLLALEWIERTVKNGGLMNSAVVVIPIEGSDQDEDLACQDFIERSLVPLGVVVVTCAGNGNREMTPQDPMYPLMSDAVIAVGGMNCHGEWWGDRFAAPVAPPGDQPVGSNWGNAVTLAAPCENIPVPLANGVERLVTGTSYAAPLVAGFVLCLQTGLHQHAEILDALMQNHTRLPPRNWDMRVLSID